MKHVLINISASVILLISGCASIISSPTQKISVNSIPSGAMVTAEPGGYRATTPGKLVLKRDEGPYLIKFTLDGYKQYSVMLSTETNGWVWGNLLLGGLIGLIIDSSTGAWIKLSPSDIRANLIKASIEPKTSINNTIYVFNTDGSLITTIEIK